MEGSGRLRCWREGQKKLPLTESDYLPICVVLSAPTGSSCPGFQSGSLSQPYLETPELTLGPSSAALLPQLLPA